MSANKYRNTARQEADEARLKELEAEQEALNAPAAPEPATFAEPTIPTPEVPKNPQEETWEKRYGDLRRFHQKELEAREKELKDLRAKIAEEARANYQPPKNKAEVQDWAQRFPDVYGMVRTVAYEEVQADIDALKNQITELRDGLSKKEQEAIQATAFRELMAIHPDFLEIRSTTSFKEWLTKQSKLIQDALMNSWDVSAAAAVIEMYKAKHQQTQKAPETDTRREAAQSIRPGSNISPGSPDVWSESRFEKLDRRAKEKVLPEVEKAIREGKFVYDLSGAAR